MGCVLKLLRVYGLGRKKYEVHRQNNNPAKRHVQDIKGTPRTDLDCSVSPNWPWILCMAYVI